MAIDIEQSGTDALNIAREIKQLIYKLIYTHQSGNAFLIYINLHDIDDCSAGVIYVFIHECNSTISKDNSEFTAF